MDYRKNSMQAFYFPHGVSYLFYELLFFFNRKPDFTMKIISINLITWINFDTKASGRLIFTGWKKFSINLFPKLRKCLRHLSCTWKNRPCICRNFFDCQSFCHRPARISRCDGVVKIPRITVGKLIPTIAPPKTFFGLT